MCARYHQHKPRNLLALSQAATTIPDELADVRAEAKIARVEANRSARCALCALPRSPTRTGSMERLQTMEVLDAWMAVFGEGLLRRRCRNYL